MSDRDYVAEMRAVIDAETSGGPYSSPVVAAHIVEKLQATDADLLNGWLHAQAVSLIRHAINLRDCSVRSHARTAGPRSVFATDAEAAESGESDRMQGWLGVRFVIEGGVRSELRDMSKDDLLFASADYEARARDNRMTAAFLKAIARKVKTKVADHFDDNQLAAMWNSLTGR
jgi:hypothetical protein